MKELFSVLMIYLLAFLVAGLIFGLTFLTGIMIYKMSNKKYKGSYLFQFWGFIAFVVIYMLYPDMIRVTNFKNVFRLQNFLLMIVAALPINIYFYYKGIRLQISGTKAVVAFFDGISMEIPQRLFMQNLFLVMTLGSVILKDSTWAVLLNALIWVQCILVQEFLIGERKYKKVVPELITSFWFSIWIGILYFSTGNILLPMITHGLLRIFPYGILDKLLKNNKSYN